MNREIKFEYGFESVNGIIKKVYALAQIPNISIICDVWNELPIVYVRQFTGLKDVDGVDIYDGDIIEYTQHYFNTKMLKTKRKEVKWKYDKWGVYETNAGETNVKVIGNIYQNKELLVGQEF